jgi:spore coat polysaccharide biosynthesis protein SpsF (cytidylyltransferase family)
VDTEEDLALMREIFEALYRQNPRFSTGEAIRLVAGDERLQNLNRHVRQRIAYEEKENAKAHG